MKPVAMIDLIKSAVTAAAAAYAPASGFKVGAALLGASGQIFTGCNIENASLGLSICAERVALFKAVSEGAGPFTRMAVMTGDGRDAPPCGACRQVLLELAPGLIITYRSGGELVSVPIENLLSDPFTGTGDESGR